MRSLSTLFLAVATALLAGTSACSEKEEAPTPTQPSTSTIAFDPTPTPPPITADPHTGVSSVDGSPLRTGAAGYQITQRNAGTENVVKICIFLPAATVLLIHTDLTYVKPAGTPFSDYKLERVLESSTVASIYQGYFSDIFPKGTLLKTASSYSGSYAASRKITVNGVTTCHFIVGSFTDAQP